MASHTPQRQSGPVSKELLQPSLSDYVPQHGYRDPPWRQGPQIYLAFFGGVLPYAVIAYLNGKRLRMSRQKLWTIALIGVVGFVLQIVIAYWLSGAKLPAGWPSTSQMIRILERALALLLYVIINRIQKPADRVYHYFNRDEYASLLKPGTLVAIIGLSVLQAVVIIFALGLLGS